MIGFIINAGGIYQREAAAYDVGTGVVPEHRRKGVFSGLFARVLQVLWEKQAEKYYLEVFGKMRRQSVHTKRKAFPKRPGSLRWRRI